jgi:hypothetical protein
MGPLPELADDFAHTADADVAAFGDAAAHDLDAAAQQTARDAAADVRLDRSAAGPGALQRFTSSFRSWASRISGSGRASLATETRTAVDKAASSEATNLSKSASDVKGEADAFAGKSSEDKLTDAENTAASQGWSTTDYLAGIAGITIVSLGLASWTSTNGARLNINDITIVNATTVRVDYDVASVGAGGLNSNFALRVGDYISFDQPTPTVPDLSEDQQVVGVEGDHTFYIQPNPMLQTAGGFGLTPAGTPAAPAGTPGYSGAPIGSAFWHQATVHSTMANQLTGQIKDGIQVLGVAVGGVASAAAGAASTVITTLTPAGAELLGAAAGAADAALHAVSPAVGGAFCDLLPIACNSTLWWSLLALCICLAIIGVVLKLKK